MFNDLNNANPAQRSSVDDIFAETDKAIESNPSQMNAPIQAQRVGLTAEESNLEQAEQKKSNWFKIATIVIVVIIVVLGAYLIYTKFLKSSAVETPVDNITFENTDKINQNTQTNAPIQDDLLVPITSDLLTPDNNGLELTVSDSITTDLEPIIPSIPVDSDGDGLTDDEENIVGTNINVIDTDNDGLSDYEEVIIYKTNPLSADSDGDTYQDGQEVLGGYNPNGPGKLPGNIVQ